MAINKKTQKTIWNTAGIIAIVLVLHIVLSNVPPPPQYIQQADTKQASTKTEKAPAKQPPNTLHLVGPFRVGGVSIINISNGDLIYEGEVDLLPTLEKIAAGEKSNLFSDGKIWNNPQKFLPEKPQGYYYQFFIPTQGKPEYGPQCLIVGANGEIYYSPNSGLYFIRVDGDE